MFCTSRSQLVHQELEGATCYPEPSKAKEKICQSRPTESILPSSSVYHRPPIIHANRLLFSFTRLHRHLHIIIITIIITKPHPYHSSPASHSWSKPLYSSNSPPPPTAHLSQTVHPLHCSPHLGSRRCSCRR